MSFQPNFRPSPKPRDGHWRANPSPEHDRLSDRGLQQSPSIYQKLTGFFDGDRLPMYKDKPYFAPRRTGPRRRWSLLLYLMGLCTVVFLLYHTDYLSVWRSYDENLSEDKGLELWKWTQSLNESDHLEGKPDWAWRRQKVRDAVIVSWEGYENEAWGKCTGSALARGKQR